MPQTRPAPHRARSVLSIAVLVSAAGAVAGCGEFNVRQELGLLQQGPDEFQVLKQGELQMPSDMSNLPTPQPGARSLVAPDPIGDAQRALAGAPILPNQTVAASGAETELLRSAGAEQADARIRQTVEEDVAELDDDIRLLDGLLGKTAPSEQPLDPAEEAARLADIARQGKNPDLEPLPLPEPETN